jgi:hypothetical protein
MNCTEFEDGLHDLLDAPRRPQAARAGLSLPAEMSTHVRSCEACRHLADRFQLLAEAIADWREQIPEVDLTEAVLAARRVPSPEVRTLPAGGTSARRSRSRAASGDRAQERAGRADRSGRSRPRPFVRGGLWLVAAGLTAIVAVAVFFPRSDQPVSPDQPPLVAKTNDGPPADTELRALAKATDTASEDDLEARADVPAAEAGPAAVPYVDLAQKAAGALDDMAGFMMAPRATGQTDPGAPGEPGAGWIDGLQHQLKPISRSLDHAFDFLWQAGQSADRSRT